MEVNLTMPKFICKVCEQNPCYCMCMYEIGVHITPHGCLFPIFNGQPEKVKWEEIK
jgi:hypothetical protein